MTLLQTTLRRTALTGPRLLRSKSTSYPDPSSPRLTVYTSANPRLSPTLTRLASSTPEATPGPSTNAKNPVSSGGASQSINLSRGKEARSSDTADTRSTQSPISSQPGENKSAAHEGEEQTSADAQIKNDPRESDETKRKNVEAAGRRKLGPEDDQ